MNRRLYIRATMLEDGQARDLVIVDGVVAEAIPVPARGPDAVGWVLPGLVDVHNHLSLASPAGDHEEPAVRVRASASVEVALGVLAIREPGSPDDASLLLAAEVGWPRVVTAGRFLAPAGGYFPGLAREVTLAEPTSAAVKEVAGSGPAPRVRRAGWRMSTDGPTPAVGSGAAGGLSEPGTNGRAGQRGDPGEHVAP
jgi:hypothetical protein